MHGLANFKFLSTFCLSATQDKCTSVMELLTLCYKDRCGVAHQSRCRREGIELFERHSSRECSSQVLERDVTKIERETEVPSVCLSVTARCCQSWHQTATESQVSEKKLNWKTSSNYYWAYLENFKIMEFMTDWFVKLNFVTLRLYIPVVCHKYHKN